MVISKARLRRAGRSQLQARYLGGNCPWLTDAVPVTHLQFQQQRCLILHYLCGQWNENDFPLLLGSEQLISYENKINPAIASTYWILTTWNDVSHFYVVSHLTVQAPGDADIAISIGQKKKTRLRKHGVIAQGHRADERWSWDSISHLARLQRRSRVTSPSEGKFSGCA